jgi:hypothetical protein
MPRRLVALPLVLVLALAAAGCGSGTPKPYTAAATATCLRTKGFTKVTTNADKVGFVAGFADNGGLRATSKSGNVVTIAFAADADGVAGTEKAFADHASGVYKRHIRDVMESQGNAVLVWTVTPSQRQLQDALSCLSA